MVVVVGWSWTWCHGDAVESRGVEKGMDDDTVTTGLLYALPYRYRTFLLVGNEIESHATRTRSLVHLTWFNSLIHFHMPGVIPPLLVI
jgi:hypothetical protein